MRWLAALAALLCLGAAPPPGPVALDVLLAETPAPKLSDYRLFTGPGQATPNAGLTPYDLNTPLFSDYAEKHRFLYLPPGAKVRYREHGAFEFPIGAALVKTFGYPGRRLETRLLIRKTEGWTAFAYVWNDDQTEAVLRRAGARLEARFTDPQGRARTVEWAVPNQNQCKECHQLDRTLVPIGPNARNLNRDFAYASGPQNQLAHWTRAGLLAGAPRPEAAPRTARWDDPAAPLADRARAYLDVNCAHCHNPRAVASNSGLYLDLDETRPAALGVGKGPVAAGRGSGGLRVGIEPGRPQASILVHRMTSTEPGVMMPELGRTLTHDEGLALVRAWIAEMPRP
ncbi:SO2930 family diheme c-type cytochrome [Phenylobacterium sp. SCN 70-31]|uniref:SO2930 family diheme c-type cytochrome n=1 Tax=Phenylobacterium sp. SCN 70-31 TaxID=1660129 RepID=UPI000B0C2A9F|nr:SO2930 family diheme c-type cytochrome [Phenylobacterium sp. SCN 70-31]